MRNLIIKRNIVGFSDGPYGFKKARFDHLPLEIHEGTEDIVFPVNGPCPDLSNRMCALDRNDLDRCFFTVNTYPFTIDDTDGDITVEYHVHGPCICFSLRQVQE